MIKESLEETARREFGEETGFSPEGEIKQKSGKIVHAWAIKGNPPLGWELKCNTFKVEWPPRSGKWKDYPEVDKGCFF
nr:NTP pyrophosphohydrolase [Bacteroidota bacterium]